MAKPSVIIVLGVFMFLLVLQVESFTSPVGHSYNPYSKLKMKKDKGKRNVAEDQSRNDLKTQVPFHNII